MQCEQIRPLIQEYVYGGLPSYKGAWVSQHLAWCKECQFLVEKARRHPGPEAEVAAARPERSGGPRKEEVRPVLYRKVGHARVRRRPSSRRWRRVLVVAAACLFGAGALWVWQEPLLKIMTEVSWTKPLVKLGILP